MHWNWTLLRAGTLRLDGGGMFGVVPKTLWSRTVPCDDLNRIELNTNCLLLQPADGSRDLGSVLIETGYGDKWTDKERDMFALQRRTVLDALAEINFDPAIIRHVIVSHLHFDHAAGLTRLDAAGKPTRCFPNADVITQRTEWDDALANKSTMTRTYLRTHLDPVRECALLIDGASEVLPGIHVAPVPGHTWGQQSIRFHDGAGWVCFAGDVLPTVHHVGLAWSIGYDMLPYQNMLTKKALLEQAAREDWRLAIDHEPGHAVVRVKRHAERPDHFQLVPA